MVLSNGESSKGGPPTNGLEEASRRNEKPSFQLVFDSFGQYTFYPKNEGGGIVDQKGTALFFKNGVRFNSVEDRIYFENLDYVQKVAALCAEVITLLEMIKAVEKIVETSRTARAHLKRLFHESKAFDSHGINIELAESGLWEDKQRLLAVLRQLLNFGGNELVWSGEWAQPLNIPAAIVDLEDEFARRADLIRSAEAREQLRRPGGASNGVEA